jgi:putative heme-binding domain-containing protein
MAASVAGGPSAWAQRDLTDIPESDPELERRSFVADDGIEVTLYASDPQISKPIQMNFDERGRLWVASSSTYPQIKPGQKPEDKIIVLEDEDGDGRAEKSTVFADGLLIPTGVLPGDGGVYVAESTALLHLSDTDNDGKADQKRVVLTGFGTEDTHHLLHTLRWGVDGRLYMNQSIYIHSHVETPFGVKRLNGGGIWRLQPDTLDLDVVCYGFVNPWGHRFDKFGQQFATDGAYGEGINWIIRGAEYVTAPGVERRFEGLNPGSPKHCGLEIVSGGHAPEDWRGTMITNDFRGHRVSRFRVDDAGAGYASTQLADVLLTPHVAFRPIDVTMGPDGAIYIADWYNPIIQHGEVDFRDDRRDHTHGRIWRLTFKDRDLLKPKDYAAASIEELLAMLSAEENWVRIFAKRELKRRDADDVFAAVHAWQANFAGEADAKERSRLEALWTLETIGRTDLGLLDAALASTDPHVCAGAVPVAWHWRDLHPGTYERLLAATKDEHPRVQLEAVRALASIPRPESVDAIAPLAAAPQDRFLDYALWKSMRELAPVWLPSLATDQPLLTDRPEALVFALKSVQSQEAVDSIVTFLAGATLAPSASGSLYETVGRVGTAEQIARAAKDLLARAADDRAGAASDLARLAEASASRQLRPVLEPGALNAWLNSKDAAAQGAAFQAAAAWRLGGYRDPIVRTLNDANAGVETRRQAAAASVSLKPSEAATLLAELAPQAEPALATTAVETLASLDLSRAAAVVATSLSGESSEAPVEAFVSAIVSREGGAEALAASLDGKTISGDVGKRMLRSAQAAPKPSDALIEKIRTTASLADAGWKWSPEFAAEIVADVKTQGHPHRGEAIYRREALQCIKCHAIAGAGPPVGPDLVSVGASAQADYLLESLIVPVAKVKEGFHAQLILDEEGKVTTGVPAQETETELLLRTAENQLVRIDKKQIAARRESRSLMPDGLVDALTREELVDLVAFLSQLGKVGEFAVPMGDFARTWEYLPWTQAAFQQFNRNSFDAIAKETPDFEWKPTFSLVSGHLPVQDLPVFSPFNDIDPTAFLRTKLEATTAGPVTLKFGDTTGLQLWLDGQRLEPAPAVEVDLEPGIHRLFVGVSQKTRTEPLRIEIVPPATGAPTAKWVGP